MRNRKTVLVPVFIVAFLIAALLLAKPAFRSISGFLSKTEQAGGANILLVEGWLPVEAIEKARNEFRENGYSFIVTTGNRFPDGYLMLSMNGNLVFYIKDLPDYIPDSGIHVIEADVAGALNGKNASHFNLIINDTLIGDFNAGKRKKRYGAEWEGRLTDIDSIIVQFDNDAIGKWGDRNLFVKEITIDHKITIPCRFNSVYHIFYPGYRIENNIDSYAGLARNRLLAMDVPPEKIISVQSSRTSVNRTLKSALAFREWLKTSGVEITGINIVSVGSHSRRTWITYEKLLGDSCDIGIISIPDQMAYVSRRYRILKLLRESAALIYYRIILIPYQVITR